MRPGEAAGLLALGIAALVFLAGLWAGVALIFAVLGEPPVAG